MELLLKRAPSSGDSTIGELSVNGKFECYTLEDVVRPVKISGLTAIPAGHYEVVITYSARFKRPMPLLLNVPQFEGIRIHVGNEARNTEGCILVGVEKKADRLVSSKKAFDHLFPLLAEAAQKEKIFMLIQ
jgi:hypothetical protein